MLFALPSFIMNSCYYLQEAGLLYALEHTVIAGLLDSSNSYQTVKGPPKIQSGRHVLL